MDQKNNLPRFMIHEKMTASGADLAAEKTASNRGSGPMQPPKKVGLANSRILGMLVGREEAKVEDGIMGDLA